MKKISVAIDFKNNAYELLNVAVNWCKLFKAELNIIHIDQEQKIDISVPLNLSNPYNSEEDILQAKVNKDVVNQSQSKVEDLLKYLDTSKLNITYNIKVDAIDNGLKEAINSENPDLLIISITNDLDTNHFEPTTLYRLFEAVDTPVLAIPSDFADYEIKRMVFAYDKKSEFTDNLNASRDLAAQMGTEIYNVKVFPNELDYRKYINEESWKDSAYDYCFTCSDVYSGLLGFMSGIQGDLLVINHEKRGYLGKFFHESMTKKFLMDAKLPLLIFDGHIIDWNLLE
ncbi:universal stress protein [Flavobacteriales bacterium]|jgi:hypothetical protein|nr:universal stress protein [Flavobacteriales bacterium]